MTQTVSTIDLHVHSNASDGTLSPTEVVACAHKAGLRAFALTDHDTVAGVAEAKEATRKLNEAMGSEVLECISGTEISAGFREGDIHILGLDINEEDETLLKTLKGVIKARVLRNQKMIERLGQDGIHLTYEELQEGNEATVVTRAHFARALLAKGYVSSRSEAFDKYLDSSTPYYVPRIYLTPEQVVQMILRAGGKPVLAHPLLYHLEHTELCELIQRLYRAGLYGIEAIYSSNHGNDAAYVRGLAKDNNLKITGGSDFHGANKPDIHIGTGRGNLFVPYSILEEFREEED